MLTDIWMEKRKRNIAEKHGFELRDTSMLTAVNVSKNFQMSSFN